jgi:hypothetical protein
MPDKSKTFHSRETEIITVGSTKATSSKIDIDFHDLPYAALEAAGRRFAFGRKRHGRFNWKQGNKEFAEERLKHLVNHVALFCEERRQEDLDAILCNAMMIAWFNDHGLLSHDPVKDFMYQGLQGTDGKPLSPSEIQRRRGLRTVPKPGDPDFKSK